MVGKQYEPGVLTDTKNLSLDQWLEYRRLGIGGSDVGAILGLSPFRTARDIYFDKIGMKFANEQKDNWVALEIGHLLEDLVAKIFSEQTGLNIFQEKKMFFHPDYPFMLADLDYLVTMPDGTIAILEIKTTNYHARNHWWKDGKEVVPAYYEVQARHYMAVRGVEHAFFCCLYGNNESEVIIRHLQRDRQYEEELIFSEEYFWNNHVEKRIPPPYTENGDLIMRSLARSKHLPNKTEASVQLPSNSSKNLEKYLSLQQEKKEIDEKSRLLEKEIQRLKALIIEEMGHNCIADCQVNGRPYTISYIPYLKPNISAENLKKLELLHPDLYEQYVTMTETRRFLVKVKKDEDSLSA